jgi:hypothetical protein
MTEEQFEEFWDLQAQSHRLLGKTESLLKYYPLSSDDLDEMVNVLRDSNETIRIAKEQIKTALLGD